MGYWFYDSKGHMLGRMRRRSLIRSNLYINGAIGSKAKLLKNNGRAAVVGTKRGRCLEQRRTRMESDPEVQIDVEPREETAPILSIPKSFKAGPVEKRPPAAGSRFLANLQSRMDSARFRWINEKLYTSTGSEAAEMFESDPGLFDVYHRGFSAQVNKWPANPLDHVINYIRNLPIPYIIADLGCGEGRLALSVPHTVHSFDLVSVGSHVTSCDMTHLPLSNESVNVVVFCLSLMGTNLKDYLEEAWRILSPNGILKITEVVSRLDSINSFVRKIEALGFELATKKLLSKMFINLELRKCPRKVNHHSPVNIKLKPCSYKKR